MVLAPLAINAHQLQRPQQDDKPSAAADQGGRKATQLTPQYRPDHLATATAVRLASG